MSEDTKNPDLEQETQNEEESTEETEASNEEEESEEESSEDVDLKAENAKLRRLLKKKVNTSEPDQSKSPNTEYDSRIERLELKQEGYSDAVIDNIMELGGKQALKNPIVASAVDGLVQQERNETASNVDGSSQSSTRTKVSVDELKNMSSAEMEKHLPKA